MSKYPVFSFFLALGIFLTGPAASAADKPTAEKKPVDPVMAAEAGCAMGAFFGAVSGGLLGSPARNPHVSEAGAAVGMAVGCASIAGTYYVIQKGEEAPPAEESLNQPAEENPAVSESPEN